MAGTRRFLIDPDPGWLQLAYLPGLVGGLVIHAFAPLRLFPASWVGLVVGGLVLGCGVAVVVLAARRGASADEPLVVGSALFDRNLAYYSVPVAYVGISLMFNSVWPLALLVVVYIFMIKLVAIWFQTGRRQA